MPSEVICITKERRDFAMDKDFVLYLLMDMRVNGIQDSRLSVFILFQHTPVIRADDVHADFFSRL